MTINPNYGEMVEHVYHCILEQLDGAEDDDTIRARLVLEDWVEQIRAFRRPRAEVVKALEQAIAEEWTAGELRRRIRAGIAETARGGA